MTVEPSPGSTFVLHDHGRWWAWDAVEVTAAHDLTRTAEFRGLEIRQRLLHAARHQAAFLDRLLALAAGEVMALRILSDGQGRLRVFLVVRASGASEQDARRRSEAVLDEVKVAAPHVEVERATAVGAILHPFDPAPGGLIQMVKQVRRQRPIRADAHLVEYLAVEPIPAGAEDWNPMLQALAATRRPTCLTVTLTPQSVPDELRRMLEREAARYARLKVPLDVPAETGGRTTHPADNAAAVIEPIFSDALVRYVDRAFEFSVILSSGAPLDRMLAEVVGRTLCAGRLRDEDRFDTAAVSAGYAYLEPRTNIEHDYLRQALARLQPITLPDHDLERALADDRDGGRLPLRQLRVLVDRNEALSLFRLPLAVDGRVPGFPVVAPPDAVRTLRTVAGDTIELGTQGATSRQPVLLPLADLPRHGFIVGTPGSGKTNTALHLCRQLWACKIPFLVVEPVNAELDDYRWLATQPGFEDLLVLTAGNESIAPLRLNPFEVPVNATVSAHLSNLLACFEAAFGLWDPMPFIYRRALVQTYRARGFHADQRGTPELAGRWPVLGDFVANLTKVTAALGYTGEIGHNIDAAARLRAEALAEGACGTTLDCRRSFPIVELLRRPVVVELAGVGDNAKEQALLTLLLLTAVRGARRAAPRSGMHVVLLEEAHRVFPRVRPATGGGDSKEGNAQALAAERIAQGLAEDRKYGQSYILIDQQVGKVAEDAYKITNLKVMHRTAAAEDRELLGATMSLLPDQTESAAALAPFQAVVSHNRMDGATTVTVPDVRRADAEARGVEEAPLATDDQLRERFEHLLAQPAFADAMTPYAECHQCQSRGRFRRYAESLVEGPALSARVDDLVRGSTTGWRRFIDDLPDLVEPPLERDGDPAGVVDRQVCVMVHALRRAYPPAKRTAQGMTASIAWVDRARKLLNEAR